MTAEDGRAVEQFLTGLRDGMRLVFVITMVAVFAWGLVNLVAEVINLVS